MSHLEIIKRAPVFRGFTDEDLKAILAHGRVMTLGSSDVVFEFDSPSNDLYIVLTGAVDIFLDPASQGLIERGATRLVRMASLTAGQSFGELAMIDQGARSASAVAVRDGTTLLAVDFETLREACVADPRLGYRLMRNLAGILSGTVRTSNDLTVRQLLSSYFVRVLREELSSSAHESDPLTPIHATVTLRDPTTFIGSHRLDDTTWEPREDVEVYVFADGALLREVVDGGSPSGEVVFNALFTLIRTGIIPERCNPSQFSFRIDSGQERQRGSLVIEKQRSSGGQNVTLEWEVKGRAFDPIGQRSQVVLFLYLYRDAADSTASRVEALIDAIDMPVQRRVYERLPNIDYRGYRVLTIHHRTHEVARTLRTLHELGFELDAYIGIPYGDISWAVAKMLDHAANHKFRCLRAITHPDEPTRFIFDYTRSSLVDGTEREYLEAMFGDPRVSGEYMAAMLALVEFELERSLIACWNSGQRLLIYEDGGYLVPALHQIPADPSHRLHGLVGSALDKGTIVGAVEVTTAGERRSRAALAASPKGPLLPVLSTAREDIKLIYESIGVAEAVLGSASTALGNLGLPTFQTRRIAVLGGNGAIGVRLIEKVALAHNSLGNVFSVDIVDGPFRRPPPPEFPHAANQVTYQPFVVVPVSTSQLAVSLPAPIHRSASRPDVSALGTELGKLGRQHGRARTELLVANAHPMAPESLEELLKRARIEHGLDHHGPVPRPHGVSHVLGRDDVQYKLTLLGPNVVFSFPKVDQLIRAGVDTVIGITGLSIMDEGDLDAFFEREVDGPEVDELVLLSGSSKDYEFKTILRFFDRAIALLRCHHASIASAEFRAWLASLYESGLSLLRTDELQALRAQVTSPWFVGDEGPGGEAERLAVTRQVAGALRGHVEINKEVRADIGSIYHLKLGDRRKRLVMLSNGFVVNFFASFEKGVKTEYIDPIVTMQLLGLLRMVEPSSPVPAGLYGMSELLRPQDLGAFWASLDDKCMPLRFGA